MLPKLKKNGLICHIFGISIWHTFLMLLSPFQGPNRSATLLPQPEKKKTFPYHNEYCAHAKALLKNSSFHISPTCLALENFDDHVYCESNLFRFLFTTVEQTTRKYAFQTFTSFNLPHYKCPERYFHNEIIEIDILIPDTVLRYCNFPVFLS